MRSIFIMLILTGWGVCLSAQLSEYSAWSLGIEMGTGRNSGVDIIDEETLAPTVVALNGHSWGGGLFFLLQHRNLQWNHFIRLNFSRHWLDVELPYFGKERVEILDVKKIRYETSLFYPIRMTRRFSAGPELGVGVSYDLRLAGPTLTGAGSGDGSFQEFAVLSTIENQDPQLVLYGYAEFPAQLHAYFVPGLKCQYDLSERWFLQMRLNYEVSGSEWIGDNYIQYVPTGAESKLSYKEGGVFNVSVAAFLRGPFGKKRSGIRG